MYTADKLPLGDEIGDWFCDIATSKEWHPQVKRVYVVKNLREEEVQVYLVTNTYHLCWEYYALLDGEFTKVTMTKESFDCIFTREMHIKHYKHYIEVR